MPVRNSDPVQGKRVLQLVYGLGSGGIESFVTNLNGCREIFPEPFDMLLYSPEGTEDFYEPVNRALGSEIFRTDVSRKNFLFACLQKRWQAYRFLKNRAYAVVHIHNSSSFCILEAILAKAAGVPMVIVHAHNTALTGRGRPVKQLFQLAGRLTWGLWADCFCACSAEAGRFMFGTRAVETGRVRILRNGIPVRQYAYDPAARAACREQLGWEDCMVIGHAGRFTTQKNHVFLLKIFQAVLRRAPTARLLLFGTGELESAVRAQVHVLGLDRVVCFGGLTEEMHNWMQAMDLFLLPSLHEGLPVSGLEAQAAGLPVLVSDAVSPELAVTDHVHFLPLSAGAETWAEAALSLLQDPPSRDSQAQILEAGCDIETTAQQLWDIYNL